MAQLPFQTVKCQEVSLVMMLQKNIFFTSLVRLHNLFTMLKVLFKSTLLSFLFQTLQFGGIIGRDDVVKSIEQAVAAAKHDCRGVDTFSRRSVGGSSASLVQNFTFGAYYEDSEQRKDTSLAYDTLPMHSSTKLQSLPIIVVFLCSCDKVDHKQEVCSLLYLLHVGQYNPNSFKLTMYCYKFLTSGNLTNLWNPGPGQQTTIT